MHAMIDEWNRQTPVGIRYPAIARLIEATMNRSGLNWKACHEAGVDLICATHFNVFDEWLSMPTDSYPEAPTRTIRMLDLLEELLRGEAAPYARLAATPGELSELLAIPKESPDWRVAVVHSLEGGHALGGRLDVLEPLAKRGVATITITHFFNKGIATSANSYPFFPDANAAWPQQGLSGYGREVIMEMERQGIIVDIIHATSTAIEDIFRTASRPLIASHASARTLGDHPYGLIDEHIEEVARRGGLIGVILEPYLLSNYATLHDAEAAGTLRDTARTIRYLVKLIGPDHVGIGSDFGGYIAPPRDMNRVSRIGKLRSLLRQEFNDESMVNDIMANNVIAFLKKNWRPRA